MINNRYTILKKIGEGRSKVFACKDKFFPEEKIAIKILQYTANDPEIEAFNNEYEIIKRLAHPNIVSVYDRGTILELDENYKSQYQISENDKFITMEMVDGVSLDDCTFLNKEKYLEQFIHQISLVLFYIHQANYIYFDLKPENIMVSKTGDEVKIKIIDFGLTYYYQGINSNLQQGTAEYLAPEILKNEEISFNVDLYSLGILLYHIVYKKFPFRNENELEIFRAHIEKDFEFPSSKFPKRIIEVIRKLLEKNPANRYKSSLEVINDLNKEITFEERLSLNNPLKCLSREEIERKIKTYIEDDIWGRIAVITGDKGVGKSSLLESIAGRYPRTVLIRTNNFISAKNFWQQFFSRLLYSETIYRSIDDSLIQYVSLHIDDNSEELLVELKTIVSKIASITNFTLLIDDFDKLEAQNFEMLLELFPILLANQIKIIISANTSSDINFLSEIEKEFIELKPFSDSEIKNLVEISYNNFIDKNILGNLLISFSERTPAKISYFNTELIASGIIEFVNGEVQINYDDEKITKLLSSQAEVFSLLKKNVSKRELEVLEIISLFENDISIELISSIIKVEQDDIIEIITSLRSKNILKPGNQNRNPSFINIGFKQFIYSEIKNAAKKHLIAGETILKFFSDMDDLIKIRQFELAGNYNAAVQIINGTLASNNINNFPQLKIKLLQKKLSYNFSDEEKINDLLFLCEIYLQIGKYSKVNEIIEEVSSFKLSKYYKAQKDRLLGILLIKKSELNEGIKLLLKTVGNLPKLKDEIFLEVASAYIELNEYEKADTICNQILQNSDSPNEITGRAQNLLGISNMYNKSDLNITLNYFQGAHKSYTQINNFNRIAGSEGNLGNIENMLGNYAKAEKHWNKALQLNRSIGNVEQEAQVLMSSGIFYYEHSNYEKAIKIYNKAENIFKGLGNKFSFGLVNINLSESYLEICEYQKSFDAIKTAISIFQELQNNDELLEALFMKAKFFITVKNKEALRKLLIEVERFFSIKSDRGKLLFEYYSEYLRKLNLEQINLKKIIKIKENLFLNNNRLFAAEIQLLLAKEYIERKEYKSAFSLLNEEMLTDICEFNPKYEAHRFYQLSKIPAKYQSDSSITKNLLLQKAFAILQNNSISEITLFVLNDLAEFYYNRGNNTKAEEYAVIAETILEYIKSQTESDFIANPLFLNKFSSILKNLHKVMYYYE